MRFLPLLLLLSAFGFAQTTDSVRPLSNFEKFISRTGIMIRSEEIPLGRTRFAHLSYQKATDLSTEEHAESVVINVAPMNIIGMPGMFYIDKQEVPGVLQAFQLFKSQIENGKPATLTSYYYITRNNIVANIYYYPTTLFKGWYISIYQRYQNVPDIIPGTRMELRDRDLDEFIEMFKKAAEIK
jgi:hypothetical protein